MLSTKETETAAAPQKNIFLRLFDRLARRLKADKLGIAVAVGLSVIFIYMLPYIIMGENSYISLHDNLDSETLFNIINAQNIFKFTGPIPNFADIEIGAVNTFAVSQLIFYILFRPFTAYMLSEVILRVCAYFGMYLILRLIFGNGRFVICVVTASLFALVPFYVVYGLTTAGLPLISYAFYNFYKRRKLILSYILIIFFTLSSSLILSGFFVCAAAGVLSIVFLCKKNCRKNQLHFYIATIIMVLLYILSNIKLIMLFLQGYVSHRETFREANFDTVSFAGMLLNTLIEFSFGNYHAGAHHSVILLFTVPALILGGYFVKKYGKNYSNYKIFRTLIITVFSILMISYIKSLFQWTPIHYLQGKLGPLSSFSFTRIYHILPMMWYIALAFTLCILCDAVYKALAARDKSGGFCPAAHSTCADSVLKSPESLQSPDSESAFAAKDDAVSDNNNNLKNTSGATSESTIIHTRRSMPRIITYIMLAVLSCAVFIFPLLGGVAVPPDKNTYTANWGHIFSGRYHKTIPTYKQYYDEKLFKEIDAFIGRDKLTYKVGSIAMYPVVAGINGFCTVDGYFQNYSLEYKLKFRKIIKGELDKSASLDKYSQWGNRCYIFAEEIGKNYLFSKTSGKEINHLKFDTDAFKELGGEYIFSGVPINNAEENNLHFMKSFEHKTSFWKVYVYKAG